MQTVEEELVATDVDTASAGNWTLTWLEGKPVVELDDGTVIRYNAREDSATITQPSAQEPDDFDLDTSDRGSGHGSHRQSVLPAEHPPLPASAFRRHP